MNVRVAGLQELYGKMDFDRQILPAVQEEVRDKVLERWMRPRKKGLGARRNTLVAETRPLSATVTCWRVNLDK